MAGLGPLLAAAGSAGAAAAATTYGLAVIAVFAVSAALHFARRPRLRNRLGLLDRLAIFLLIAASYTPFTALQLAPPWGAGLLGLVWSLALGFGILNVAIYPRRRSFTLLQPVNLVAYLALGWSGLLVAGPAFAAALPAGGLAWLLGGGLFYTVGVAFFVGERIPYNHTVWHLFVVAGASCHYIAVLEYGLAGA